MLVDKFGVLVQLVERCVSATKLTSSSLVHALITVLLA